MKSSIGDVRKRQFDVLDVTSKKCFVYREQHHIGALLPRPSAQVRNMIKHMPALPSSTGKFFGGHQTVTNNIAGIQELIFSLVSLTR